MEYRSLGKIAPRVSRFGLGCMRLPQVVLEDGKKDYDDEAAAALIRRAIDRGVNYLDTAYTYGRSEEVVGKALRDGYREKTLLVTKVPMSEAKTHEDLFRIFDEQCRRLQTDTIDIYHLHNMNRGSWPRAKELNALGFLDKLRAQGRIGHAAFSFHERVELLDELLDAYDWGLVMVQYNYLDKFNQAGRKGVEAIARRGIPVATMEPLRGGLLSQNPPQSVLDAFQGFRPEASQAEKAFMWLYNQPEVSVVLSGSSTMEQLEDSLRIFENARPGVLSEADETVYDRARAAWDAIVKVPCTACGYCVPCPKGVNIPEVFRMYNETARSENPQRWLYSSILKASGEDASHCVKCGQCLSKCPQAINIIEKLAEAHEDLTK